MPPRRRRDPVSDSLAEPDLQERDDAHYQAPESHDTKSAQ
jgi:hypothetical protein